MINPSQVIHTTKKCIMCGSVLNVYYPYSLVYNFYYKTIERVTPIFKSSSETPTFKSSSKISGYNFRTIIRPFVKRRFVFKKYTKNKPTCYYCDKCFKLYTEALHDGGKPIYNFRILPLRKRT